MIVYHMESPKAGMYALLYQKHSFGKIYLS